MSASLKSTTDRQPAAQALAQSEERYRFLFEAAPVGISMTDFEGNMIAANRALCETLGLTAEEAVASRIVDFYADPKDCEDLLRVLQESGKVRDREVRLKVKGGAECTELVNMDLVEVGGQQLILSTSRDVTVRKRAEEDLGHSLSKLRETLEDTINALASTIEQRDPYTAGHGRRVAYLACAIAKEMGLSAERIDGIELAGLVHDIGKMAMPSEILATSRRLSGIEFDLLKIHAQVGHDILQPIDFPWPIAQMVLQHHERMNGSGYPLGLAGENILLEARILAVADVVEAMMSHRPYRPSLGIEKALEEISKGRGILYDHGVADACIRLFSERGFQLNEQMAPRWQEQA